MLRLFCDRRVKPDRYYVAEDEESMFIPQEVLECVGFIYCKVNRKPEPAGTVFFVNIRDKDTPTYGWPYAVTARHILNNIKKVSDDGKVHFRLNTKGGKIKFIETDLKHWKFHPTDPSVDVAVLPWAPPFRDFDVKVIQSDTFALGKVSYIKDHGVLAPEHRANVEIGVGEDVFITGLFIERLGTNRNIPIVRVGNIAAMAGEPIQTPFGEVVVHLIEARSTGGLSGSPVFVNLGPIRKVGDHIFYTTSGGDAFYLFGLIHGHWDERKQIIRTIQKEDVNMGIAMVVPMAKILEVLNQPALVELRQREKEEEMAKKNTPTLDTSLSARSLVEAAIGELPYKPKSKPKIRAKKAGRRGSK